jgi:hypothetical protein
MSDAAQPIMIDLTKFGGPKAISVEELTCLAVRAKTRAKANPPIGWSVLSHQEILAMIFVIDAIFEDCDLAAPPPAKPEPAVISHV